MDYYKIADGINNVSDFSEIFPIVTFFLFKNIRKYPFLFTYVLVLFILNTLSFALSAYNIHNHYVYHFIGLCELVLFYLIYRRHVRLNRLVTVGFYITLALYIADSIFFERIFVEMNSFSRSLEVLFISLMCLYTYYRIYEEEAVQNIARYPFYWINSGIFFYCSASFFTFLLASKILSSDITNFFSAGWMIAAFANVVKNLVLCVGIGISSNDE